MNSSPERQIRKFNPGTFQSDEEVIAQFVVRNRELGVVLEVVRGNIDSPSCQHILVVAPRGRGNPCCWRASPRAIGLFRVASPFRGLQRALYRKPGEFLRTLPEGSLKPDIMGGTPSCRS